MVMSTAAFLVATTVATWEAKTVAQKDVSLVAKTAVSLVVSMVDLRMAAQSVPVSDDSRVAYLV